MGDEWKPNALAVFGIARGLEAAQGVTEAYQQKVFSELNAAILGDQMQSIEDDITTSLRHVKEKSKRVVSEQEMAFVKGGVELEGTAMDVIGDTVANAAEAAYLRRRQADYQLTQIAGEKAALEEASSDMNFLLNAATAVGGAYAGYLGDMASYNRLNAASLGIKPIKSKGVS